MTDSPKRNIFSLPFFLLASAHLLYLVVFFFLLYSSFYTFRRPSPPPSCSLLSKIIPFYPADEDFLLPDESSLLDCSDNVDDSLTSLPPPPSPPPPPSKTPKFKLSKQSELLLQPTSLSSEFSERTESFFDGGDQPCKERFFMTWLSPSGDVFGPRDMAAVDSLFYSHPAACLLIASNTMDSPRGAKMLKPFTDRGLRVAAFTPDFAHAFAGTPAEQWFDKLRRGEVDPGTIAIGQNVSDLLRLALIHKYGGTYVDTDILILRSFAGNSNTIGAQSMDAEGNWTRLNNALLIFDKDHPLVYMFIEDYVENFNGRKWGYNGPYMVSRVVKSVEEATAAEGKGEIRVRVLGPRKFYPVDWKKIGALFEGPKNIIHEKWIEEKMDWLREESFSLHLWNRESKKLRVEEGSVVHRIFKEFCVVCAYNSSTF